jgi:hypothetical protein
MNSITKNYDVGYFLIDFLFIDDIANLRLVNHTLNDIIMKHTIFYSLQYFKNIKMGDVL